MSEIASLLPPEFVCREVHAEPGGLAHLAPLLAGERPQGLERWAEKRRREFAAGRQAAREALAGLGLPAAPIPREEDGVPRFPSGVRGSITHTGRSATYAVAAATCAPWLVGLDVEERRTLSEGVIARVLRGDERASLAPCLTELVGSFEEGAVLVFSAKEAVYKAIYPRYRRFLDFPAVRLRPSQDGFIASIDELSVDGVEVRCSVTERHVLTAARLPDFA